MSSSPAYGSVSAPYPDTSSSKCGGTLVPPGNLVTLIVAPALPNVPVAMTFLFRSCESKLTLDQEPGRRGNICPMAHACGRAAGTTDARRLCRRGDATRAGRRSHIRRDTQQTDRGNRAERGGTRKSPRHSTPLQWSMHFCGMKVMIVRTRASRAPVVVGGSTLPVPPRQRRHRTRLRPAGRRECVP